jgi:opacity protein-like surface antigen
MKRLLVSAVVAVGAAMSASAASADVSQTPTASACPAHYSRLSVASFEAVGPYRLPRAIDTAGNDNGYVCAFQMPDARRDSDCRTGGVIACQLAELPTDFVNG